MSFTITAELPLGTYRGAGPDGRPEPMPSLLRLHAALLCAAGFGPRAVADGEDLQPCDADASALRWLEEHPPDGVVIPPMTVNTASGTAHRDDGTIGTRKKRQAINKLPKPAGATVAVAGRFVWSWREAPPVRVREALAALCADVPYLGTTESPARLTAGLTTGLEEAEPTHDLDRAAGLFTADGELIRACRPGRTAELMTAHNRRLAVPRESGAPYGKNERSTSEVPSRDAVEPLVYVRRGEPSVDVPWAQAILVPVSMAVSPLYRVAWATAAHGALISMIGEGAPPLITGVYPTDAPRPANRLALHFLDSSAPVVGGVGAKGMLVMLVPSGAGDIDVEILNNAVAALTSLRGPGGRLMRVVGAPRVVPGWRFWTLPQPGHLRLWRTEPAAVPDIRGVRTGEWTFAHTALLSLGFVWKAQLPTVRARGDERYVHMVRAVTEASAAVVTAQPLRTSDVGRYAHRVNDHAVVRPYTARLWLGDLASPCTVAAIGQARHLGGGLLVPEDVPPGARLVDGQVVRP